MATICLGSDPPIPGTPQPAGPCNGETQHHAPFYNGHIGTHGLWLTPDGSVLLVSNRLSGTIVAIDTATNEVLGYASTGREPHLATVRPGGAEAWVAVRGESQIEILKLDRAQLFDAERPRTERMEPIGVVPTLRGPSMISFTSDGRFAFVAAGKDARVQKIDAAARRVIATAPVAAAFTPFGLVSPDDQTLYLVHKNVGGIGKVSVLRTSDLSPVVPTFDVGPCANHVFFVGRLAYITIGGPLPCAPGGDPAVEAQKEGKVVIVDTASHAIVHELTGPAFTGDPHGIWATANGRLLYVGHESGNRVTAIDTRGRNNPFDDVVLGVVTGSAIDLGFVKQPIDVVIRR
jgi:YVTN family beta-propeller protein